MEESGQLHSPGKEHKYSLIRILRRPHCLYGQFLSIQNPLTLLEHTPWTTQLVKSHYIMYIILVPVYTCM
jgi:hypothetical protein